MKRYALFVAFGLALGGCNLDCLFSACCPSNLVVDHREVDFEGTCPGPSCVVSSAGSTAVVPSLLPGDHALALDPDASVTWSLTESGSGEGTSFAMSFRCDEGGALRVDGEGVAAGLTLGDVHATRDWQRGLWPVLDRTTVFPSRTAAQAGTFAAVVHVTNDGRARCMVDWFRFVSAPLACSREEDCPTPLFGAALTSCGAECVDAQSDARNCGACGHACVGGVQCVAGSCAARPDGGFDAGLDAGRDAGRDAGSLPELVVGRRCAGDADCRTAPGELRCVATSGGRVCAVPSGCQQGTSAAEQGQCGGASSTCLPYADANATADAGAFVGLCTRRCRVGSPGSSLACPAGSICTTNWVASEGDPNDVPGCLPFCVTDADCAGLADGDGGALACQTRTGRCVAALPRELAGADGTACDPVRVRSSGADPCRGACLAIDTANPSHGLCASFINLSVTRRCEQAGTAPLTRVGDEFGLCLFAACERNGDCADGLVCAYPEDRSTTPTTVLTSEPAACEYATAAQPNGIPGGGGTGLDGGLDAGAD